MIMETPGDRSPESLQTTTVIPAAPLPRTDELPAVRVEQPPPPDFGRRRSSGSLGRAIAIGAVIGVAMIGALLLITSGGDQESATETTTQTDLEQTDKTVDEAPVVESSPEPAGPTFTTGESGYRQVVGVPDRLNVRAGPGTSNAVVGSLANAQRHIFATGQRATVNGSAWVEIEFGGDAPGWVSGRFLEADVAAAEVRPPIDGSVPPAGTSRVCFASSGGPRQVAQIDFSDHTDISGVRVTMGTAGVVSERVSGTLADGQAVVTLVNDATGQASTETWTFAPASIRSGSQPSLAVVECSSISGVLR